MTSTNAYRVVEMFEETIAEYCGSKYAVAVESCTAALFLCCLRRKVKFVSIPKFTYPSVPQAITHAGGKVIFNNHTWSGMYHLSHYYIYDAALRFRKGMFKAVKHKTSLMCLSFHAKKILPIGRGGMILANRKEDAEWLKIARYDGRKAAPLSQDSVVMPGWNMYMTPEQAARGLMLFDAMKDKVIPDLDANLQGYPDCSKIGNYGKEEPNNSKRGRRDNRKASSRIRL